MKRNQSISLLILFFALMMSKNTNAQATFRSQISGNWNQASTWILLAGSDNDADGIPDGNDSVIVRCADMVTLTADANCVNLTIQNLGTPILPTPLALSAYTLTMSGLLNGPNTTYRTNIISNTTGRIKFIGGTRNVIGSNWNGFYPGNWRLEVALNPGATGTSLRSLKVGDLIISSGNFEIRTPSTNNYFDLKIDKGAALGNGNGTLYIAPGCKLACMRCGQRTGDTTSYSDVSTYCGNIDIYGELEIHGLYLSASNINIYAGGKLSIARSSGVPMLTSPTGVSNFIYAPGSYLEYKNHSPSSTGRTQTGAEIDQASAWNTVGAPGNTVSNLIVNNSPNGIRGNGIMYIEDTLIMKNGYFDNVDMTNATIRYGLNGTLKYNGSTAPQNAAIAHLSLEFPNIFGPANLMIENPFGVIQYLSRGLGGKLFMKKGKLSMLNSSVVLTMLPSSSVGAINDTSFVNGKMAKTGATPFTFPIGKNNKYRPITVTPVGGTETFTAEYFQVDPNASFNTSLKDFTLDHVSRCEYWTLSRAGTKDANVALSWDTYSCGVDSLNYLRVAQWDGSTWKDKSAATVSGNTSSGTINAATTITLFGTTRPLTLASSNQFNPLPVDLISFEATSFNDYTLLKWVTASEKNSDYFQIDKSLDGINFIELARVKAFGNSSSMNYYSVRDEQPVQGISYYRLNEFDVDGSLTLSKIIVVKSLADNNKLQVISGGQNLIINVTSENDELMPFSIFDVNGREVISKIITANRAENISTVNLEHGFYFARVVLNGKVITEKFVY
jgi:hypothetical protein